jgi:hypothetical protein
MQLAETDDILWCFLCSTGDPEMVSVFVIFTKQRIFDFSREVKLLKHSAKFGRSLAQQTVLQYQRIHVPERLYTSPSGGVL